MIVVLKLIYSSGVIQFAIGIVTSVEGPDRSAWISLSTSLTTSGIEFLRNSF